MPISCTQCAYVYKYVISNFLPVMVINALFVIAVTASDMRSQLTQNHQNKLPFVRSSISYIKFDSLHAPVHLQPSELMCVCVCVCVLA